MNSAFCKIRYIVDHTDTEINPDKTAEISRIKHVKCSLHYMKILIYTF